MKKKLALLLAAALALGSSFSVYATEPGVPGQASQGSMQQDGGEDSAAPGREETLPEGGEAAPDGVMTPDDGTAEPEDGSEAPEGAAVPDGGSETPEGTAEPGDGSAEPEGGVTVPEGTAEPEGGVTVPEGTAEPEGGVTVPEGTAVPEGGSEVPEGTAVPGAGSDMPEGIVVPGAGSEVPEGIVTPGTDNSAVPKAEGGAEEQAAGSQIAVTIGSVLPLVSGEFTLRLKDPNSQVQDGSIIIGKDSASEGRTSFEGLAAGLYLLDVKAEGYLPFTQEILVDGTSGYAMKLMTGFIDWDSIVYETGNPHPGVLFFGDVDGDLEITEKDGQMLVDIIDKKQEGSPAADLNGDGNVDLVDLEYYTRALKWYQGKGTKDLESSLESIVAATAISVKEAEGTKAEGDLGSLLKDNSGVVLKPAAASEISKDAPVQLEFEIGSADAQAGAEAGGLVIETANDAIREGSVAVTYLENGQEVTVSVPITEEKEAKGVVPLSLDQSSITVTRGGDGNIRINLGDQVAVKKVTLIITGMRNNNNLAEISKVEFVGDMASKIPEPEMDIPENLKAEAGDAMIKLSWDHCNNVTGYEVEIEHLESGKKETIPVSAERIDITSFNGDKLLNKQTYSIRVQSVNEAWRSGYCGAVQATPQPTKRPDKPDNVSASGNYQSIIVSWKQMKDTDSYTLYYKKSADSGEYSIIKNITNNSYTIGNLEDVTKYTVYVEGVNQFGSSSPSLKAAATTTDLEPAVITKYNLINGSRNGTVSDKVISASTRGAMVESPLDEESAGTAWGTIDHNVKSYYFKNSWDDGGFNNLGANGLTYEFDQAYLMDTIALHDLTSQDTGYFYARIRYWDKDEKQVDVPRFHPQRKVDAQGKSYYVLKLPEPAEVKKIQFGLGRYSASGTITISEVFFYHYDTLMDEVMALYEDDLHTVLKDNVTQEMIDSLRTRVETPDEENGNAKNPNETQLLLELDTAEQILKDGKLKNVPSVEIHNGITTNDVGRGFGGLNAWQPLGVVAAAGEGITVYVGHNTKKTGEASNLQLVATQYHSESGPMSTVVATLKVGANVITVPKIGSLAEVECGGALYVRYTGNNADDRYAVRVSGGVQVPRLDLYKVTDPAERLARTTEYVKALEEYVGADQANMKSLHEEIHANSANKDVSYAYDAANCILGASDILLDTMMFSLPAQQILAGAGSGTTEEKAAKILASMDAMDDMMYLFYQHKGLNANAPDVKDQIPKGHLNVRYQRMFSGAFMYASGNHIGIEYGSASGMVTAVPVTADEKGKYVPDGGRYFGWGIAHEIGHCINQGDYAVAEITNNYFAVLAQAKDDNKSVRFQYDNVYKKVASGAKGRASNVFTQLGMYWQLHLAYDKGYNFKTYENYEEQLNNLFFARVDTYSRTPSKAPAPGGVALQVAGDTDQKVMRLACAAAEKNILEFFERWGMTPDKGTSAYAEQFAKETRAIYYANDDARVYSLEGTGSVLGTEGKVEAVADDVTAQVAGEDADQSNKVHFTLGSKTIPEEDVLGYEIMRCTLSGGVEKKEPAGFVTGKEFTDTVFVNNRVVWYEITLIDKYLNRSAAKVLEPIKIEYDGSLEKSSWTVSTQNMTAPDDAPAVEGSGCSASEEDLTGTEGTQKAVGAQKLIDNDTATVYQAAAGGDAVITLEFNKTHTVTGFKYTPAAGASNAEYAIQVLQGDKWEQVSTGTFGQDTKTVYFENKDGKYVSTYETTAVKLILKNQSSVAIAELDVLGPTGDNVDFRRIADDKSTLIGRLTEDFKYGDEDTDVIPKGSVVFMGIYKGNPAYSNVILYGQDGSIVGGVNEKGELQAHQVILARVPEEGNIQNVSDGTWIYWIEPGQEAGLSAVTKVRAELYRVNDALTNEGQRLVSDSLFEAMPQTLTGITIDSTVKPQQ